MIGYWNYTVYLTYFGLASGLVGIFAQFVAGNPLVGVGCLLLAGLCDLFDGKVASTRKRTKQEKAFGIQIDSLCDLICFGVLPGVTAFNILGAGSCPWYYIPVLVLFAMCGMIRLAYYNVDEICRQEGTTEPRKVYLGLPITFSSLLFPVFYIIGAVFGGVGTETVSAWYPPVLVSLMALHAIAFITPFKIKKPGLGKMIFLAVVGTALLTFCIVWACI